jgi:alkylation response protein AidB-like acyl-CoA dehydrogenase
MDFSWDNDQIELKKAVIEFARKELIHDVIELDRESSFPRDAWKKCAEFGIQGMPFPEEFGGLNSDIMTTMLVMEGLGYACKDGGLTFGLNAQMWSVQMPILRFGTEEQKKKYLAPLCKGEWVGAHCMTEPNTGSDAFSLSTTAELKGDHYVLNGVKSFVTNGPPADCFMIYATVDKRKRFMGITGFLLEKGYPGLRVSHKVEKMGLRTAPMCDVILEDCKVPVQNRLGKEGHGASIFNDAMEWERSCMLACHIGEMERQLETCIQYCKVRKQYGKPIGQYQSVANKLVDMKVRMETARLLLYKVGWMKKAHGAAPMEAAMAKLYVSESWIKSCLDAVQIHGGYGYTTEYELERDLRNSIGGTLYSGTSEIQKNIIAKYLGM